MKNKIKFKAWDKKQKVMVAVGNLMNLDYSDASPYKYISNDLASVGIGSATHQWQDIELLEFSNHTDTNGVEVYEKDILQESDGRRYVVEKNIEEARWDLKLIAPEEDAEGTYVRLGEKRMFLRTSLPEKYAGTTYIRHFKDVKTMKIIGNSLENSELLKL